MLPIDHNENISESNKESYLEMISEREDRIKKLEQWLGVVLDQIDYTAGACSVTEMVGAVLDKNILTKAKKVLETK